MAFFSLVLAFLLEQARPLGAGNPVHEAMRAAAAWCERSFNAGQAKHGVFAWIVCVGGAVALVWGLTALAVRIHPLVTLAVHVGVLYCTLGFRQFSHYFTDIQLALACGDIGSARRHLEAWKGPGDPGFKADGLKTDEICRIAIAEALLAAYRHVFAVMFWYVVLPGPLGAVIYRMAEYVARRWGASDVQDDRAFSGFARKVLVLLDWPAVRATAIGFAIVGNFEEAIYRWRQRAGAWRSGPMPAHTEHQGILVESASGALGVRLAAETSFEEEVLEAGSLPDASTLQSAVGLVWRSVVLWMTLVLLLSIARWAS